MKRIQIPHHSVWNGEAKYTKKLVSWDQRIPRNSAESAPFRAEYQGESKDLTVSVEVKARMAGWTVRMVSWCRAPEALLGVGDGRSPPFFFFLDNARFISSVMFADVLSKEVSLLFNEGRAGRIEAQEE